MRMSKNKAHVTCCGCDMQGHSAWLEYGGSLLSEKNELEFLVLTFRVQLNSVTLCSLPLQAEPIRVVVTGAAGQIAYSLLYSIAKGDVFGKDQVGTSGCVCVLVAAAEGAPVLLFLSAAHNCYVTALPSGWMPSAYNHPAFTWKKKIMENLGKLYYFKALNFGIFF